MRKRLTTAWVAAVTGALITSSFVAPPAAEAASTTQPSSAEQTATAPADDQAAELTSTPVNCADILVVGVRGSGEPGEYGTRVGWAVDELARTLEPNRSVRYVGLDYPAAGVDVLTTDLIAALGLHSTWQYFGSVNAGILELNDVLGTSAQHCPDEKWILTGYSQGALVINEAVRLFPDASRYAGILQIADPARVPNGAEAIGEAPPGYGITQGTYPTTPFPQTLESITTQLCLPADAVCDSRNANLNSAATITAGVAVHSSYTQAAVTLATSRTVNRALSLTVPTEARQLVKACGANPRISGQVKTKPQVSGAPTPAWTIAPGYSPRAGITATRSSFALSATQTFALAPTGSFSGSLPVGSYQVPIVATIPGFGQQHLFLDVVVFADCEAAVKCGPELASSTPQPAFRPDASIVSGRVLCPNGLPAGGMTVTFYDSSSALRVWNTRTDRTGTYRLELGGSAAQVLIESSVNYPAYFLGGALDRSSAQSFTFPMGSSTLEDHVLEEYGYITGDVDIAPGSSLPIAMGNDCGTVMAISTLAEGASQKESIFYDSSRYSSWSVGVPTRSCALDSVLARVNDTGGYKIRVIQGTYHVGIRGAENYPRWVGGAKYLDRLNVDNSIATEAGRDIVVRPGQTVDAGTTEVFRIGAVQLNTAFNEPSTNLSQRTAAVVVSTYRLEGGSWRLIDGTFGGGQWMDRLTTIALLPGTYRIAINDPGAYGYDPGYVTRYFPNAKTLSLATSFTVQAGVTTRLDGTTYLRRSDDPATTRVLAPSVLPTVTTEARANEWVYSSSFINSFDWVPSWPTPVTLSHVWKLNGVIISREDGFTLPSNAAGKKLTVTVTGTSPGLASASQTSQPVTVQAAYKQFAVGPLLLDGVAQVGRTLTVSTAQTWTPAPSSIEYQWLVDGMPIPGANSPSYTISPADLGKYIGVRATATRTGYSSSYHSAMYPTPVAKGILTAPQGTIAGLAVVGQTLSAQPGSWTPATSYSYQWYANGLAIPGATTAKLVLKAAQAGQTITVSVTGNQTGYETAVRISTTTPAVTRPLTTATAPTLSGGAAVGKTLTATTGTWSPSPLTFTYQWKVNNAAVAGATKATFTIRPVDLGKTVTVTVTATVMGYQTTSRTSAPTSKVANGTLASVLPTVLGTPKVGVQLTAKRGKWTAGTVFTFQWLADGKIITGATNPNFAPTPALAGRKLSVKVTGTLYGYTTLSKTSALTAAVGKGTLTAATPTISGTPRIGATLTAQPGTWSPGTKLTYQWFVGGNAVVGSAKATFVPTSTQVGQKVVVQVTGTLTGFTPATKKSLETATLTR